MAGFSRILKPLIHEAPQIGFDFCPPADLSICAPMILDWQKKRGDHFKLIIFYCFPFFWGGDKERKNKQLKVASGLAALRILNDEKQAMWKRAKRGSGVVIHLIRENPPTSNPRFKRHCFKTAGENGELLCCTFKALKTVTKETIPHRKMQLIWWVALRNP